MSFLDRYNSEILSTRITNRGRQAIANGNFIISYFQVGDSEFDYTLPFTGFTGENDIPNQKVFAPFDKNCGVKYPYKLDNNENTTTFGVPTNDSYTETLRNVMGPAGFVTRYLEYNPSTAEGTIIKCNVDLISLNDVNGTDTITVSDGNEFLDCKFITIVFDEFGGTDPDNPVIMANSNSMVYKIVDISGNVITLDRNMPDLSMVTGNAQVVCNKCIPGYVPASNPLCPPLPADPSDQGDPWTLNIVWGDNPIGYQGINNLNLLGFESNEFVSTKQFLGYTTSSGQTINTGTTYTNSFFEPIIVTPEEQRVLAIIHYSNLGDMINDPERFYKYDDYISNNDSTDSAVAIAEDENGNLISDTNYFQVYIPFLLYHRSTGTTIGAVFHMDTVDYNITTPSPIIDGRMVLPFRYLLDENENRVGRVFYTNKTIVFDDQEIVAALDPRSNRRYTLPAPKTFVVPSDKLPEESLFSGTTEQTYWLTYVFTNSQDSNLNCLPCNYFTKVFGTADGGCQLNISSNIGIKWNVDAFVHMGTGESNLVNKYIGTNLKILLQETNPTTSPYPQPDLWKEIDITYLVTGNSLPYLDPSDIENKTFIINKNDYDNASFFDLETYMGSGYFVIEPSTDPNWGDEQPFPGSVSVVRATDLEVMNFLVTLPSGQFLETQNPTYTQGLDKKVTDIALLDNNKEPLVVGKTSKPITRIGTQVFAVKLDF